MGFGDSLMSGPSKRPRLDGLGGTDLNDAAALRALLQSLKQQKVQLEGGSNHLPKICQPQSRKPGGYREVTDNPAHEESSGSEEEEQMDRSHSERMFSLAVLQVCSLASLGFRLT